MGPVIPSSTNKISPVYTDSISTLAQPTNDIDSIDTVSSTFSSASNIPDELQRATLPREWIHPRSNDKLIAARLVDTNDVVLLKPQGGSYREVNLETGERLLTKPLVYCQDGFYFHAGLLGGEITRPDARYNTGSFGFDYGALADAILTITLSSQRTSKLDKTKYAHQAVYARLGTLQRVSWQLKNPRLDLKGEKLTKDLSDLIHDYRPDSLTDDDIKNLLTQADTEKETATKWRIYFDSQLKLAETIVAQRIVNDGLPAQHHANTIRTHLVNDPGLIKSTNHEIPGTHNKANFLTKCEKLRVRNNLTYRTAGTDVNQAAIENIEYTIPLAGSTTHVGTKTAYDSLMISDDQMVNLVALAFDRARINEAAGTISFGQGPLCETVTFNSKPLTIELWVDETGTLKSAYPVVIT